MYIRYKGDEICLSCTHLHLYARLLSSVPHLSLSSSTNHDDRRTIAWVLAGTMWLVVGQDSLLETADSHRTADTGTPSPQNR